MTDLEKKNLAMRLLEEAADKGALKGLRAEDMLQGMLSIYVHSRLGPGGNSLEQILFEVTAHADEYYKYLPTATVEVGPPLGNGND